MQKSTLLDIAMKSLDQYAYYVKCFDDDKTISFLADDKEYLKEYIKVWVKIRNLIDKKSDAKPVYGDKYMKAKIKSYNNDIRTNFHSEDNNKKVPKEFVYM